MATRSKINPDDILAAALKIVRQHGEEKLTAREIAKIMGCSTQPIIYNFSNMDNLRQATLREADRFHTEYIVQKLQQNGGSIQQLAMSHVEFARDEKNLFKFLFLDRNNKPIPDNKPMLLSSKEGNAFTQMTAKITGLPLDYAQQLFTSMWWQVHGIATLVATDMCYYTDTEIIKQLRVSFRGLRNHLKQQQMLTETRRENQADLPYTRLTDTKR